MREWSSARWILVLLSLVVAGAGSLFLVRSGLLTGAGVDKGLDEQQAEQIRKNEAYLKRIEELERVYREEILPTRERLVRNREQLEALLRTLPPEIGGVASNRGSGEWLPPAEGETGVFWGRIQEALQEAARDPRIRGEVGSAGQEEGEEAFRNASPHPGNGYVQ